MAFSHAPEPVTASKASRYIPYLIKIRVGVTNFVGDSITNMQYRADILTLDRCAISAFSEYDRYVEGGSAFVSDLLGKHAAITTLSVRAGDSSV